MARVAKLEALGFAWELPAAGWEVQLTKLQVYKREHGDCNVPRDWAEDPALGSWVMTQRNCKRKLDRGDPRPKITAARAAKRAAGRRSARTRAVPAASLRVSSASLRRGGALIWSRTWCRYGAMLVLGWRARRSDRL